MNNLKIFPAKVKNKRLLQRQMLVLSMLPILLEIDLLLPDKGALTLQNWNIYLEY